jgi:hypothetical protein
MFADDNAVEEKTSSTSGQVVQPANFHFAISCEISPSGKPVCYVKYPNFIGSETIEELDPVTDGQRNESRSAKKSQPKTHSKKSTHNNEDEDDEPDTKENSEEDNDDEDEEHQPILECISRAYPDD